jgi:hypothetical protein
LRKANTGLIALQKTPAVWRKPYIAGNMLSLANVTLSSFRTVAQNLSSG